MAVLESLKTMTGIERFGVMMFAWALIWAFTIFMIWNGRE